MVTEPVPATTPEIWLAAELFTVNPLLDKLTPPILIAVPVNRVLLVRLVSPVKVCAAVVVMLAPSCDVLLTATDWAPAISAVVRKPLLAVMLPKAAVPPTTPFKTKRPMVEVELFTPTVKPFQVSLLKLVHVRLETELLKRTVPWGSPLVPNNSNWRVALL